MNREDQLINKLKEGYLLIEEFYRRKRYRYYLELDKNIISISHNELFKLKQHPCVIPSLDKKDKAQFKWVNPKHPEFEIKHEVNSEELKALIMGIGYDVRKLRLDNEKFYHWVQANPDLFLRMY